MWWIIGGVAVVISGVLFWVLCIYSRWIDEAQERVGRY